MRKTRVVEQAIVERHLPRNLDRWKWDGRDRFLVGAGLRRGAWAVDHPAAKSARTTRIRRAILRLALGAITVSRRLWFEAGMANSPSIDPKQIPRGVQRAIPPSIVRLEPVM
jgi:hypothetical protein